MSFLQTNALFAVDSGNILRQAPYIVQNELLWGLKKGVCERVNQNAAEGTARDLLELPPGATLTVKLFLSPTSLVADVELAVQKVLDSTSVRQVGLLLLSSTIPLEQLKPFFAAAELLVDSLKVRHIGVCDLDVDQLKMVVENVRIKPFANQIATPSSWADSRDVALLAYCKEQGISLIPHPASDNQVSLEQIQPTQIFSQFQADLTEEWTVRWAARYSILVEHRLQLISKGYILGCTPTNVHTFSNRVLSPIEVPAVSC